MNDLKFKIGDRVRYIGEEDLYLEEEIIANGKATYEVVDAYNCGTPMVLLKNEDTFVLDEEDVELVSRPSDDPKTAFLTELKALMEKYDAYIVLRKHIGYKEKNVMDIVGHSLGLVLCNEVIGEWDSTITPSNIFDYDK